MGLILGVILGILFVLGIGYMIFTYSDVSLNFTEKSMEIKMKERQYQGPVPEGYDEDHFRKTGETIPLE